MRGDGRIFKRAGICWIAYYGPDPARPGYRKEFRESTECACTSEPGECRTALRELRGRLGEIHGDRFVGPQQERTVIASLLDAYKAHRERSGKWKSADRAASQVERVKTFFGTARAAQITTASLETWAEARLADGFARATVRQWLATLRAAMRLAVKKGKLSRVPFFPTISVSNTRQGFFERDEFLSVVEHLDAPWKDMAWFAYLTGWRPSEIFLLPWECVDRRAGVITLPDSKNGRARTVPTSTVDDHGRVVLNQLGELIERRWTARMVRSRMIPLVFHRKGRPIKSFRKRWAAACITAGFYRVEQVAGIEVKRPTKLFYDLRRSSVRDMVRAGVPETVAMSISGHRTRHVFDRYNITSVADQQQAIARTTTYRKGLPKKITDISRTKGAVSGAGG